MDAEKIHHLELDKIDPGSTKHYWLHIINDSIGEPVRIPILVKKGSRPGPVLGLTAALHGNELNGIPVIQNLFEHVDVTELAGTVIGVLVANIPGLVRYQRNFNDNSDLNRIAPGRPDGNQSEVYIHRLIDRVVRQFQYHIDLHTASAGRRNSHYVRASMDCGITSRLALLQGAQIVVAKEAGERTLRGAAHRLGIKSLTVELRDPAVFQDAVIDDGLIGVLNVMKDLNMLTGAPVCRTRKTVMCTSSEWLYTDEGGILRVYPRVAEYVNEGDLIAEVKTIFGKTMKRYHARTRAIVIGKSVDPLNQTGSRIIHLGYEPKEVDIPLG